jgi:hypothetical protein
MICDNIIDIIDNIDLNTDNKLDDDWINKFEETDKLYQDFYKDNLYYTNVNIVYINKNSDIEKIKQEMFLMSCPNIISKEEVIGILKRYSTDNDILYSLLTILKYNITLEADEVKHFLLNKDTTNYLTIIKNIDDIKFEKSISMLHDLNELYFLFCEKSNETKKNNNNNNITKKALHKIFGNNKKHKKTIKKQYKD